MARNQRALAGLKSTSTAALGLWYLGSMFNHACVPNCKAFFIGDMMFVKTLTAVEPGTELCFSYMAVDNQREVPPEAWTVMEKL